MKATVCVDVDSVEEMQQIEQWFATWRDKLSFVSEDQGCGCCVHIWDVDGPPEAIDAIPTATRTQKSDAE